MRHVGALCKLIDYSKTVEFFTLKTCQCKKGNNADSRKNTVSAQCLHRSHIFYILKFNMNFQVTIIFFAILGLRLLMEETQTQIFLSFAV